ncbi:hypothetical protein C1J01_09375 [Nonomuraea aridisoli]|uniref:DUF4386 family protein n=2 Tax=Nonomuraea aridisoli TaxID=2070368 RepID=A0A2W2ED21_9ACTN|nr:hypothetical protein C1J01_09375 [Nonomuraea aridisoli]
MSGRCHTISAPTSGKARKPANHTRPAAEQDRSALGVASGAALALFVVMFGTWAPMSPDVGAADAAAVRAWVSESAATLRLNAFAGVLALVALIVLTGALSRLAGASALREAVLLGGGLLVAINAVVTRHTLLWVLSDVTALDDAVVSTWYSLSWLGQMLGELSVAAQSVLMGAFSIAALRAKVIGRWLGWLGIVLAATGLVSVGGLLAPSPFFDTAWPAGLYGWTLWLPVAGVALGLRR